MVAFNNHQGPAFRLYVKRERGQPLPKHPDASAHTLADADRTAQLLADATGLEVVVYPCLCCRALIGLRHFSPSHQTKNGGPTHGR